MCKESAFLYLPLKPTYMSVLETCLVHKYIGIKRMHVVQNEIKI